MYILFTNFKILCHTSILLKQWIVATLVQNWDYGTFRELWDINILAVSVFMVAICIACSPVCCEEWWDGIP